MKNQKLIQTLTILIIIFACLATLTGLFSNNVTHYKDAITAYGESVVLYNKGIYARDSISMSSQAIGQDIITLVIGIPLLVISLVLIHRKNGKGKFLLTGILGYFLYTYTSYSFLILYNRLYLVYITIMALSFYGFILCIHDISTYKISDLFHNKFPVKSLSRFLWIVGGVLVCMWLSKIIPTIVSGKAPTELEHYSTMGIQTLDLGFVAPASIVAGCLLSKKNKWGYLLSVILVLKGVTMTAAVTAMAIGQRMNGVKISIAQMALFPILCCICIYFMIKLFRQIRIG